MMVVIAKRIIVMKPVMNFIATGSLPFQEKQRDFFLSILRAVCSRIKSLILPNNLVCLAHLTPLFYIHIHSTNITPLHLLLLS